MSPTEEEEYCTQKNSTDPCSSEAPLNSVFKNYDSNTCIEVLVPNSFIQKTNNVTESLESITLNTIFDEQNNGNPLSPAVDFDSDFFARCFFDLTQKEEKTRSLKPTESCCVVCNKPFSFNFPAIALECACVEYPSYHRNCIKDAIYAARVKNDTTDSSCFACSLCNQKVNYEGLFDINHTVESINKLIFGAEAYFQSEYKRFIINKLEMADENKRLREENEKLRRENERFKREAEVQRRLKEEHKQKKAEALRRIRETYKNL